LDKDQNLLPKRKITVVDISLLKDFYLKMFGVNTSIVDINFIIFHLILFQNKVML